MDLQQIMGVLSRNAFASASLALMALSFALVIYGASEVILAASWVAAGEALLIAIGYVVIAMAVYDVAKYSSTKRRPAARKAKARADG